MAAGHPTSTAGAFRIVKKTGTEYEVYFKNFRNDVMLMVADGRTKDDAHQLKEDLNAVLFGESPSPGGTVANKERGKVVTVSPQGKETRL